MRFIIICIAVLFLHFEGFAQITMQNGKVMNGNEVFCTYEETGKKVKTIPMVQTSSINNPESRNDDFRDYVFSTINGSQEIFCRARVASSTIRGRLLYYYHVDFISSGITLDIAYHPLAIQTFIEGLSKYNVLTKDGANENAVGELENVWRKKGRIVSPEILAAGASKNYNSSEYNIEGEQYNEIPISVKSNNIYYGDSLIATYRLSNQGRAGNMPGTGRGYFYYILNRPNGGAYGDLQVMEYKSSIYVWPVGTKNFFEVFTPERNEEKMIAVAAKVLVSYYNHSLKTQ
ncbi:MAG: hypothetical protein JST82_07255 [Bacteroidetes bacterium]|nr:hypothetical protein [Bacteroidota bacterium]